MSLRPATRAAPGSGRHMAPAATLGFKPGPLHKLLIVKGRKAAVLQGCLPPLYAMQAIPVLSGLLLTPSTPAEEGLKMASFSLRKFTLPRGLLKALCPREDKTARPQQAVDAW